jgi:glycosyltransferase involved in cell wall biosynthesis
MLLNLSLIIPHQNQLEALNLLLKSISLLDDLPSEIIIIDSSSKPMLKNPKFEDFCALHQIQFIIHEGVNLFPGHARTIGITKASHPIIAFLDAQTLPPRDWLESYHELILDESKDGIMGSTLYAAYTFQEKVIRASTYGCKPIITLPGSILRKAVFNKTGVFIPGTRAGEDMDWMERAKLQNLDLNISSNPLDYTGLDSVSSLEILKKWYRNYVHTAKLPFFKPHRDLYIYMFFILLILAAYNWNSVVASWDPVNELYIPNITKITFGLLLSLYAIVRSLLMPLRKGVQISFLFPFGFIAILLLSFCIDFIKFCAFAQTKITTLR